MPRIDFYTKVADPQAFACRLAQTVFRKGERLLVWLADEDQLAGFSARLWSIADTQFVPHCRLDADEAQETPIWLTTRLPDDLQHAVLLNLGPDLPEHPEHFARILEIVGCDEASLETARERFRFYRLAAYEIEHHDMSHL